MFEVGFWELILVLVLVLVVAGPARLPEIVRTLGRLAGRAKAMAGNLKQEFERELDAEELRQIKRDTEQAAREVEADIRREPPA
jgi:sec-independent protein translocase protein TatB